MEYKILEINENKSTVTIECTFDDGEKYTKRMMANTDSEESIKSAIEEWISNYLPQRKVKSESSVQSMVGKKSIFSVATDISTEPVLKK